MQHNTLVRATENYGWISKGDRFYCTKSNIGFSLVRLKDGEVFNFIPSDYNPPFKQVNGLTFWLWKSL